MKTRGSASAGVIGGLQSAGEVLWLQLLFLACSIPVVTAVPAALVLLKALKRQHLEGGATSAAEFLREFIAACRQCWLLGLLVPLLAVLAAVSAVLWSAAPAPLGPLALGMLIPLAVLAAAAYLVFLGTASEAEWTESVSRLLARAGGRLLAHPIPPILAAVALAAWTDMLVRVPTLALAGSGLVPAVLAWMAVRSGAPMKKEHSE